ncbi:MAG: mechanosensitive ion channel family protein [Bacilli bacterium]
MNSIIDVINGKKELLPILKEIGLKLVAIILLILILTIISKVLIKLVNQFLDRQLFNEKKSETIKVIAATIIKFFMIFTGIIQILNVFNINSSSFVALSGVIGIALGLGAQDFIKDILSGVLFIVEDQFNIGDYIIISGVVGCVESINLRTTSIRSNDGGLHIFPNRQITYLTNMTKDYSKAIIDLSIGYSNDIDMVLSVVNEELEKLYRINDDIVEVPIVKGVAGFNESGMLLKIIVTCATETQWAVGGQVRLALKRRFDQDRINIAYPYTNVIIETSTK